MRRAWVEVDLGAMVRNAERFRARAGVPLLPMVKADGYGLGAVRVARALERVEPWGYGISTVPEGEELRQAGIERPLVLFTPVLIEELDAVQRARITPALSNPVAIARWSTTRMPWHLAIDTGLSRAGVLWDQLGPLKELMIEHPPEGVFTHLHSADLDDRSRDQQEARFQQALDALPFRPPVRHVENGAAVQRRAPSPWTVVRPGIFLYGVASGPDARITPEPVVAVRARVVEIRTISDGEGVSYGATWRAKGSRRIATLAIGYADGYRRALSNRGSVLVRGVRAPVVGLVAMDMTMIDITDCSCEVGDPGTLIGSDGDERLTVTEVAELAGVAPYELLTGLRGRLTRRYVDRGTVDG